MNTMDDQRKQAVDYLRDRFSKSIRESVMLDGGVSGRGCSETERNRHRKSCKDLRVASSATASTLTTGLWRLC